MKLKAVINQVRIDAPHEGEPTNTNLEVELLTTPITVRDWNPDPMTLVLPDTKATRRALRLGRRVLIEVTLL